MDKTRGLASLPGTWSDRGRPSPLPPPPQGWPVGAFSRRGRKVRDENMEPPLPQGHSRGPALLLMATPRDVWGHRGLRFSTFRGSLPKSTAPHPSGRPTGPGPHPPGPGAPFCGIEFADAVLARPPVLWAVLNYPHQPTTQLPPSPLPLPLY